jgi:hypothetical protein
LHLISYTGFEDQDLPPSFFGAEPNGLEDAIQAANDERLPGIAAAYIILINLKMFDPNSCLSNIFNQTHDLTCELPDICGLNVTTNLTEEAVDECCWEKFELEDCYVLLDHSCTTHENWTEAAKGEEFKYRYCEELNPHWPHHHSLNFVNFFSVVS